MQIGDLHQPPIHRQGIKVARDIVAAHHVEDQISPAFGPHGSHEIGVAVVERHLGPQLFASRAFRVIARRGKDARAAQMGKLDRGRPDAGGTAMHQEALTRLQAAAHEDIGPDGIEGLAQARRGLQRHALGHGQRVICGRHGVFGIAPTRQQRADRITDFPAGDIRADGCDMARGL